MRERQERERESREKGCVALSLSPFESVSLYLFGQRDTSLILQKACCASLSLSMNSLTSREKERKKRDEHLATSRQERIFCRLQSQEKAWGAPASRYAIVQRGRKKEEEEEKSTLSLHSLLLLSLSTSLSRDT